MKFHSTVAIAIVAGLGIGAGGADAVTATTAGDSVERQVRSVVSKSGMTGSLTDPLQATANRRATAGTAQAPVRPKDAQLSVETGTAGVVRSRTSGGVTHLATTKDEGYQLTSVLGSGSATENVAYDVAVPAGGKMVKTGSTVLVLDRSGALVGGFLPAWARDASGKSVLTSYKIKGKTLIQHVDHRGQGVAYPVVADPLYQNGMIKKVNYERWSSKGGYIVQLQVTKLAYVTRAHNPKLVAALGYKDLKSHFPRSMSKATMKQQWDCHVLGLFYTIKIDLEGYRRSYPGWEKKAPGTGALAAYKAKSLSGLAKACNW